MEAVYARHIPGQNLRVRLTGGMAAEVPCMTHDPVGPHELCMIDAGLHSMADLPLSADLRTLNLHCNQIVAIEGLAGLQRLQHLDLSSNQIARVEGLASLAGLRTLNLSCNHIRAVAGLAGMRSLRRLDLSYNGITDLSGLVDLHGPQASLSRLDLQGNALDSVHHIVGCLAGLDHLQELTLAQDGTANPVCSQPGYRTAMLHSLPRLLVLDGLTRQGQPVTTDTGQADVPGLDQYLEYLLSSDTAVQDPALDIVTPRIDQMLDKFRQRALMSSGPTTTTTTTTTNTDTDSRQADSRAKGNKPRAGASDHETRLEQLERQLAGIMVSRQRSHDGDQLAGQARPKKAGTDSEQTDGSDGDSRGSSMGCAIRQRARGVQAAKAKQPRTLEGRRSRPENGQQSKSATCPPPQRAKPQRPAKSTTSNSTGSPPSGPEVRGHPRRAKRVVPTTAEQDADKLALMQELDVERERRWKAEQAAIRLADHIKDLQATASEERDLQDVTLQATTRLKQALMNEKESRLRLEALLEESQAKLGDVQGKMAASQRAEEEQRQALRAMEATAAKMETERLNQHAHEAKRTQEYQLRAAAVGREVDLVRAQCKQHEGKIQQLQELLATREQEHRQQLDNLYRLDSKELREVISQKVAEKQRQHEQEHALYKDKIATLTHQYSQLEDEFRLALQMEDERFREVQAAFERVSQEAAGSKQALATVTAKERRASGIVTELTAMVKEQKGRLAELSKAKHEVVLTSKERIQSLESQLEAARGRQGQFEVVRQEKSRLASQLVAQESVIEGLKAERKLWSQELAQQGSSLAQDRGRLEARIEALSAELSSLKKQSERDNDALKIKTKMLDDQTDTIRKLKEGLVERDEEIKKCRDESLKHQRSLEAEVVSERSAHQDATEEAERLRERKEELKAQVTDLHTELDESRRAYRSLDNKWKEKGDLIGQLETQVRQVKQNFDARETKLKEEKEKALQAEKAAVERLRQADEAFAQQLETVRRHHDAATEELKRAGQRDIDVANQRVLDVENEMRQLLAETDAQKRTLEEKVKRLTSAFSDLTQGLT